MDDITSLRQVASNKKKQVVLYKPGAAYRVRWDMWTDTPLPGDEPTGENPPDGAIIDYYLEKGATDVTLDICDDAGNIVRQYSSKDTLYTIPDVNIPLYWIRPQQILSGESGAHRFLWDMHYAPLNIPPVYPIGAIVGNTAPAPTAPWVMPGNYLVKLTVNGKIYSQPLKVIMDPRVKTSMHDLQKQHNLSYQCYMDEAKCIAWTERLKARNQAEKAGAVISVERTLRAAFDCLQGADVAPTTQCIDAAQQAHVKCEEVIGQLEKQ